MKKVIYIVVVISLFIVGCESLRYAPSQSQKKNAYLHNRTAIVTSQVAQQEATSAELQALTQLGARQSDAFVSYFGLPEQLPQAETAEEILSEENFQIADTATLESAQRPDGWELADAMLELGIGISALLGGVYGSRAVSLLNQAREKSKALQEIIAGNELFKKNNAEAIDAFKAAQAEQSPSTRRLVAEMKG